MTHTYPNFFFLEDTIEHTCVVRFQLLIIDNNLVIYSHAYQRITDAHSVDIILKTTINTSKKFTLLAPRFFFFFFWC